MTFPIFTSIANHLDTTRVRTVVRAFVAGAVATAVGYLDAHNFTSGHFALIAVIGAPVYFGAIHLAEIKFPKLGWLLGLLPQQKTTPVAPTPKPTPAPVNPTPAPVVPAVTKTAAKSKESKVSPVKK